jgi:hypothetical protein
MIYKHLKFHFQALLSRLYWFPAHLLFLIFKIFIAIYDIFYVIGLKFVVTASIWNIFQTWFEFATNPSTKMIVTRLGLFVKTRGWPAILAGRHRQAVPWAAKARVAPRGWAKWGVRLVKAGSPP